MNSKTFITLVFAAVNFVGCKTPNSAVQSSVLESAGTSKNIMCQFYYKASANAGFSAEKKQACDLTNGPASPMPEDFSVGKFDFTLGCDQGMFLNSGIGTSNIQQLKHQQIPAPVSGGHGFTGYNQIFSQSGSQVDYWCEANGSQTTCKFFGSGASKEVACQITSGAATLPETFKFNGFDFEMGCSSGFWLRAEADTKVIHEVKHQDIQNPTHGFTGLNYLYSPMGEEVQYWCSLGLAGTTDTGRASDDKQRQQGTPDIAQISTPSPGQLGKPDIGSLPITEHGKLYTCNAKHSCPENALAYPQKCEAIFGNKYRFEVSDVINTCEAEKDLRRKVCGAGYESSAWNMRCWDQ